MCTIEGSDSQNNLGVDVRPRQNSIDHEDLFLSEYARYILHKKMVSEGVLTLYANPFYPRTEIMQRPTDVNVKVKKDIDKKTIATKLQKNEQDISLREELITEKENEEWIEINQHNKTKPPTIKEIDTEGGLYDVLQSEEVNGYEDVENTNTQQRKGR